MNTPKKPRRTPAGARTVAELALEVAFDILCAQPITTLDALVDRYAAYLACLADWHPYAAAVELNGGLRSILPQAQHYFDLQRADLRLLANLMRPGLRAARARGLALTDPELRSRLFSEALEVLFKAHFDEAFEEGGLMWDAYAEAHELARQKSTAWQCFVGSTEPIALVDALRAHAKRSAAMAKQSMPESSMSRPSTPRPTMR